jgi:hypothetical protein
MSVTELASVIGHWPLSLAIAEGDWAFPLIECVHVLAFTIVVGSIAALDLRLLGVTARGVPVSRYSAEILPITWIAFGVAAIAGSLLFISRAETYVVNIAFRVKLLLLVAAGVNMLVFHTMSRKTIRQWDADPVPPPAVRLAGALSLLIWSAVILFGRWVGFTLALN